MARARPGAGTVAGAGGAPRGGGSGGARGRGAGEGRGGRHKMASGSSCRGGGVARGRRPSPPPLSGVSIFLGAERERGGGRGPGKMAALPACRQRHKMEGARAARPGGTNRTKERGGPAFPRRPGAGPRPPPAGVGALWPGRAAAARVGGWSRGLASAAALVVAAARAPG